MGHLCFGSYTRILLYKAAPTTLPNKKLCGLLLKVFNEHYDITGDDDTVSKLLSGSQNIAPDIVQAAATSDPHRVEQYFEREIIHRLSQNKKKHIVLALKELILSDNEIAPETQLGTLSNMTKAALQSKKTFAFTEFLTDVFLYTVKNTDNRIDKKNTKLITRSYCDLYEGRLHEVQLYELPQIRPVSAIPMTVKAKKFDQVFTKVAEDTLSSTHPGELKLYRLGMDEDGIDYRKLHSFLINTIGEYVYSRVQVSEIIADDEYGTIAYKALSLMNDNASPDEKGSGNELGELLLYVFLEHILQAPKLMSKVELAGLSTTRTSRSDGIHLLVSNGAVPFNQLVFGASMMDGKLEAAIDAALAHVIEIKNNKAKEYDLVESGMFYRSFDKEVSDRIKDIIIPQRGRVDKPSMAFGVFLGYTLGMSGDIDSCVSKMESDIKRCMEYMKQRIQILGLPNSNKKVWWKCLKGHEWQALISNRNKGTSCPYCAGQKVIKGYNDLGIVNPKLAQEWNYEKNGVLKPEDFTESSGKRVWWKCNKGHEWQARIADRTVGHGCPYCSNRYIIKGENDLQTANPTLASEWNYEKNENLKPENFTANSGKKVWWKCRKGHEWQATIVSRNRGNGCPICSSEQRTSFPEYAIVYYLSKYGLEVMHSYKEQGYELDIYIPAKRIAIEYDGYVWHKNKTKQDLEKNYKCAKDGIKLYRIREGLPPLNGSSIDYVVQRNQEDLPEIFEEVLSEIVTTNVDVDIDRDSIAIENLREYNEKVSSLLYSSPEIADEWNCEKNGKLKPEHFTANSHKKVWWKCSQGHEWQSAIANRTRGNGCPYCSGQKVLMGYNDLQTVNPTLAKEWNYEKNGELTPSDITPNSSKIVWWKCQKGHEWQATIANRNKGNGCPYCSGRFTLKNENDLQTVNPTLANEWNYEKNNGLTPKDVLPNSNKKVWWKCGRGHEWQATIVDRNTGHGCPYCSGRMVIKGHNDLQTVNPLLAEEWSYGKNDGLRPDDVKPNSHKKVWWKCNEGHEWQATIASRNNGRGCPICRRMGSKEV